MVGGVVWVMKS